MQLKTFSTGYKNESEEWKMIKIEYKERLMIEQMCRKDYPVNKIAEKIGVSPQTIYKELKRGGYEKRMEHPTPYSAALAQGRTKQKKWG
ncbi:helix-turn-helix domain-containing protein [Faecalimonas umbilicata]|uniref:helix-turn-helix domain-containing protein n=1 Tax=Faecalimonas umbilicata TaxID=1912855 RepID=UPI0022E3D991|nr:helix-turn-helix domain-containing protein [Faecalimonas umbilicata]